MVFPSTRTARPTSHTCDAPSYDSNCYQRQVNQRAAYQFNRIEIMTSVTQEIMAQMREPCSHGAVRSLRCPAPKIQTSRRGVPTTLKARLLHKRHLIQVLSLTIAVLPLATTSKLNASPEEDARAVAALDTKYQAAVKANDAATMDQILAEDFVLVTGRGAVFSKSDLLDSAQRKEATYERQDEELGTQTVRVWRETA